MNLELNILAALGPAAGALAAIAGWRTGAAWAREAAQTDVLGGTQRPSSVNDDADRPLASTLLADRSGPHGEEASASPSLGAMLLAMAAGLVVVGGAMMAFQGALAAAAMALGWSFIYAAYVDARAKLLPDWPSAAAACVGLYMAWRTGGGAGLVFSASGAAAAGLGLWLVAELVRRRVGREALGAGDIKAAMAGGTLLGPAMIWTAIGAAAAGTVAWALLTGFRAGDGAQRQEIPFGPALLGAIWAGWIIDASASLFAAPA